ncbi:MAG: PH domain-containing protein [Acidobacteriota bacterium]
MPSERRLHPWSIFFGFLSQIRALILPGLFVLVGASSRGRDWEPWMMVLIVPSIVIAVVRYISFRYWYGENELVIRSGLLFRKERHIPYSRIQNVDVVQRPLHRLLSVAEVRVETGGGETAEATMTVLPMAAFREMRERVFADRGAAADSAQGDSAAPAPPAPLLDLGSREVMLSGFIENRGAVVIGAAFGLAWEMGVLDRTMGAVFGTDATGRGVIRDLARAFGGGVTVSAERIALTVAAFAAFLLFIRVLSMGWAIVRLHGFRLTLVADDLRSEYGLLTKVAATVPLRRIQTLTIRETPLHRWFERVAVRADTAGGRSGEGDRANREWPAPVIRRHALRQFVMRLLGQPDLDHVNWEPVSPRAFRREIKGWLVLMIALQIGVASLGGVWALSLAPLLVGWALVGARQTVGRLGWALDGDAVLFREGWLWRRVTIVRSAKIQTVTLAASPFDRWARMARVRVDTAGASGAGQINIPYLERDTAETLHAHLADQAGRQTFTW